ncbi:hypothetical protein SADUNF_Sadunf01G0042100 [Salix dunnii]|uniref:Uncharacterized protein n=1 Tax=Salix dunnii TaxID=1413687 RepID=A0A835N9U2_9ROSI|nr:hypothetical protein SADUNF_Sadunf01G0042100 [Salix dunnii]
MAWGLLFLCCKSHLITQQRLLFGMIACPLWFQDSLQTNQLPPLTWDLVDYYSGTFCTLQILINIDFHGRFISMLKEDEKVQMNEKYTRPGSDRSPRDRRRWVNSASDSASELLICSHCQLFSYKPLSTVVPNPPEPSLVQTDLPQLHPISSVSY